MSNSLALLVGDNPFHRISHLSQERARARRNSSNPEYAASLVMIAHEYGANGFMFSVSETTLSILEVLRDERLIKETSLWAIVPYAYEYIQLANQVGGIPGLAKNLAAQMMKQGKVRALTTALKGGLMMDPKDLMRAYLSYEISKINSAAGKEAQLKSVLLHQVVTDLALALNLEWFFKDYVDFMSNQGIIPGFNTGNYVYLIEKLLKWEIDIQNTVIAAPFNQVGFQMCPSRIACERVLERVTGDSLIAISILAAGYLQPLEAVEYIMKLPNLRGVTVGISREIHAKETFRLLKEKLSR